MLKPNMPSINDQEDAKVPSGLPAVIDAQYIFSPRVFFMQYGNGLIKMAGTLDIS